MTMTIRRFLVAPDSFKGSLSAADTAAAIADGIRSVRPDAEILCFPIADGGEGSVDALGAQRMPVNAAGPDGYAIPSFWGKLGETTAVIEMAAAAGLPQSRLKDPERTTTFGVGELILAALKAGCRNFVLGLGGSATNDAGCGMAAALGAVFTDKDGRIFLPIGGTLGEIAHISLDKMDPRLKESAFTVMCDVTNPLYGGNGAAFVFAPQKGADAEAVLRLDAGLRNFAAVVKADLGRDLSQLAGGGAAGGMGAGAALFLGAELKSGIRTVLDLRGFDDHLTEGTVVFTGEGKFDASSLDGKAVSGVAARAAQKGVPVVVLAGSAEAVPGAYERGVTAVFSVQSAPRTLEEAMRRCAGDLREAAANLTRLICL